MNKIYKADDKEQFSNLESKDLMTEAVLYNCSARIEKSKEKKKNSDGHYETKGNVTECGLLNFLIS